MLTGGLLVQVAGGLDVLTEALAEPELDVAVALEDPPPRMLLRMLEGVALLLVAGGLDVVAVAVELAVPLGVAVAVLDGVGQLDAAAAGVVAVATVPWPVTPMRTMPAIAAAAIPVQVPAVTR